MARVWEEQHGRIIRWRGRRTHMHGGCGCSKRMKGQPRRGTGCKTDDWLFNRPDRRERKVWKSRRAAVLNQALSE